MMEKGVKCCYTCCAKLSPTEILGFILIFIGCEVLIFMSYEKLLNGERREREIPKISCSTCVGSFIKATCIEVALNTK